LFYGMRRRSDVCYGVIFDRSTTSARFPLSISAGVFIPWRGGTDESGAAKFLLDLLGPPDGEVAAGTITPPPDRHRQS
jgi:hypothetical protein